MPWIPGTFFSVGPVPGLIQTKYSSPADWNILTLMSLTPTSAVKRMREVAGYGDGFIYCLARKEGLAGRR